MAKTDKEWTARDLIEIANTREIKHSVDVSVQIITSRDRINRILQELKGHNNDGLGEKTKTLITIDKVKFELVAQN